MTTQLRDNQSLLDAAFKSIVDVDALGQSRLSIDKFDQFVEAMQLDTRILPEARYIEMNADRVEIDRVGFSGRITRPGNDASGNHVKLTADDAVAPDFATNRLDANELVAVTGMNDKALRRNIEREGFASTLVDLFGERVGLDLEEYALFADKNIPQGVDSYLRQTDGWLKLAANRIFGRQVSGGPDASFDPEDTATINGHEVPIWIERMFNATLEALPKRFMRRMNEWRFYVPFDVANGYADILKARGTNLGDRAIWEINPAESELVYKGIPIVYVPIMEEARTIDVTNPTQLTQDSVRGRSVLLTHPNNLAWGVFHEVTIEPRREPLDRETQWVLSFEGDVNYEDENGAVAAFIDRADPESS